MSIEQDIDLPEFPAAPKFTPEDGDLYPRWMVEQIARQAIAHYRQTSGMVDAEQSDEAIRAEAVVAAFKDGNVMLADQCSVDDLEILVWAGDSWSYTDHETQLQFKLFDMLLREQEAGVENIPSALEAIAKRLRERELP